MEDGPSLEQGARLIKLVSMKKHREEVTHPKINFPCPRQFFLEKV
jgi:hypothetical protein